MTRPALVAKRVAPTWMKEASRPAFRSIGRMTWRLRPLPDYLIIGTKRGGTQSMFQYLQRHPNVLPMWPGVENAKKTHFFDRNHHRGEPWYRAHFPTRRQRRRTAGTTGPRALSGEAAPYYMFHPLVAGRVAEMLPDVKIIVLLRNPVRRAWSHYHERVHNGVEPLSFREALEAEPHRLAGEVERILADPRYYSRSHDFYSYLARGRYLEHLRPWYEHFDPAQIHVIRSEDLYADPGSTLVAAHRFLDIPAHPPAPHRFNYVPAAHMDPETEAWLRDYYRPHVEALQAFLGHDFGWDL